MVAQMFEHSAGSLSLAVIEHGETFEKGLDPEIDQIAGIGGSIDPIQKRSKIDQLGSMLEEIGIGDFRDGQGAGCGIGHEA
tara:strand:+ start:1329 stop:1571 length:243 start_codon:yes stop_codon:yes gene_type:complete